VLPPKSSIPTNSCELGLHPRICLMQAAKAASPLTPFPAGCGQSLVAWTSFAFALVRRHERQMERCAKTPVANPAVRTLRWRNRGRCPAGNAHRCAVARAAATAAFERCRKRQHELIFRSQLRVLVTTDAARVSFGLTQNPTRQLPQRQTMLVDVWSRRGVSAGTMTLNDPSVSSGASRPGGGMKRPLRPSPRRRLSRSSGDPFNEGAPV